LKMNPYAPTVPCHRVVATSRRIGGFQGHSDPLSPALSRKVEMLRAEGVLFEANGKINEKCMLTSLKGIP
jgi:methylated-DNA-[protein]-cysteine S-methyltransferase